MSIAERTDRITRYEFTSEWLAGRKTFLGASESPAVLGCGYSEESPWTVWASKTGLVEDEDRECEALECGQVLQPAINELLRRRTGYDCRAVDLTVIRHPEYDWLGFSPDSIIEGHPRGRGVAELKNVGQYNAADWKSEEPPLRHMVQLQHQLLCAGATWGIVAGLIGGNRLVYREVEISPRFIDAMLPELRKFWRLVETKTPPEIDSREATARLLARLYPEGDGEAVQLEHQAIDWFEELRDLKERRKAIEKREAELSNRVKLAIGTATYGRLPGEDSHFSWKQQTSNYPAREAYSTTFRVLRLHDKRLRVHYSPAQRLAKVTAALIEHGATLIDESASGSRYFELCGGLVVRVADHEPNDKTDRWMDRQQVASVRIDRDEWQDELRAIVGEQLCIEG